MPQLDMDFVPERRHWGGVRIEARFGATDPNRLDLQVMGLTSSREWSTVWVGAMFGVQTDLFETFVTEVATAWQFGERRDLVRAASHVIVLARRHERDTTY